MPATPLPREEFPVASRYLYFDHATASPLPLCAANAAREYLDDVTARGGISTPRWEARVEEVRVSAAALLDVPESGVAFVKSATEGMALLADGLSLGAAHRVVVPDHDVPATMHPWFALRERDGDVHVDVIDPLGPGWTLPLDHFRRALQAAPTSVVAASWVQFGRGWRCDLGALAALCHEHGALLGTDLVQGLGVLPAHLEDWGVDFAVADGNTWMLGPRGSGVLYVSEATMPRVRSVPSGVASTDTARRFEDGALSFETITQLGASIDLILKAGIDDVWGHVDALLDQASEGLQRAGAVVLSDRSAAGRSASITVQIPGQDPTAVCERLQLQDIICAVSGGGLRISPHGYNTGAEVDRLVQSVRHIVHG